MITLDFSSMTKNSSSKHTNQDLVNIIQRRKISMKLYLDFDPCAECKEMMTELSSEEMLFADDETRADISAKFLRH